MECGFASRVITPPVGTMLHGFGNRDHGATGALDDQMVSCAAFSCGDQAALLVTADILSFSRGEVPRIKREISHAIPVPPDGIMLAASHTHSGPAVSDLQGMGEIDREYGSSLRQAIVATASAAFHHRVPARLAVTTRAVPGIGAVREGPAAGSDAPNDTLTILQILHAETDALIGLIYTYGCHPVTLGNQNYQLSAEYPGVVRRIVRDRTGIEPFFLLGAAGDVNPSGMVRGAADSGGEGEMRRIGESLAGAVLSMITHESPGVSPVAAPVDRIRAACTHVPLPTVSLTRRELRESDRETTDAVPSSGKFRAMRARWTARLAAMLDAGECPDHVDVPVQVFRIGDAVLIGVGAELFSQVGSDIVAEIRRLTGPKPVVLATCVNGCTGYVCSHEAYESAPYGARWSAYWYDHPPLSPDADRALVTGIASVVAALWQEDPV